MLAKLLFGDLDEFYQNNNQSDAQNNSISSKWNNPENLNKSPFDDDRLRQNSFESQSNYSTSPFSKPPLNQSIFPNRNNTETETDKVAKRIGVATKERVEEKDDLKNKYSKKEPIPKPGFAMLLLGVILPCLAMCFESNTHFMAKEFFDPFPTFNHYLLFGLIPASNLLAWLSARTNITSVYSLTALGSGMALGIGILYSLMLLPLTPMMILMFPLGVLGLAPLLSIPCTVVAGKTICKIAGRHDTFFDPHQFKHLGHLIILVMVISVELPSTLTRIHLTDAASNNRAQSQYAIDWLRNWGSKEVLLRACYERSGRATDLVGSLYEHQHPISIDKARNIYYKVTGVAFNAVPIPNSFRSTIQHNGLINDPHRLNAGAVDEFDLDPDIAGEMIQGVARGLSVKDSQINGLVDGRALIAKLNWTIDFTNISKVPREVRAKIQLPPNSVVSRATMWIDGEEKEAKVMGRARARKTYQRAVKTHKRDPLLVSMQGKDIVLVQCYPVLKGSDTKVRLKIISPLKAIGDKKARLVLPTFAERNFSFSKPHNTKFQSNSAFTISNTTLASKKNGNQFAVSGELENKLLSRREANLIVEHNPKFSWAKTESTKPIAIASLNQTELNRPEKITVILDKSIAMKPYWEDIKKGLNQLPEDIKVFLIEVGDNQEVLLTKGIGEPNLPGLSYSNLIELSNQKVSLDKALELVSPESFRGGRVNSGALANVISRNLRSQSKEFGDILWIHGQQPVSGVRAKKVVSENAKYLKSNIYDLQIASGPNALFDKSSMIKNYIRVSRSSNLSDDIKNISSYWKNDSAKELSLPEDSNTVETIPELSKLIAYKEVLANYYQNNPYVASALAVKNHIISPVTSFVVSDDKLVQKYAVKPKQQYRRKLSYMRSGPGAILSMDPLSPVKQMVKRNYKNMTGQLDQLSSAASGGKPFAGTSIYKHRRNRTLGYSNEGAKQDLESRMEPQRSSRYPATLSAKDLAMSKEEFGSRARRQAGSINAPGAFSKIEFKGADKQLAKKAKVGLEQEKDLEESSAPVLQGATNGSIVSFDDDTLELSSQDESSMSQSAKLPSEKETFLNQGEVVPEPETLPMLLLALMVLAGSFFLAAKRKPA